MRTSCMLSVWIVMGMVAYPIAQAVAQLDDTCTISIGSVSANVIDDQWVVRGILVSNEPRQARVTCEHAGITLYGESAFFDLVTNGIVTVDDFSLSATAFPSVVSIEVSGPTAINLSTSPNIQLSVTALMTEGPNQDVTQRAKGTSYRSSNPAIASVDINGLVTGLSPGGAYITVTNRGASKVKKLTVADSIISATIQGYVQLPNGLGVDGAIVRSSTGAESVTSSTGSAPGFFSIALDNIAADQPIRLSVLADIQGQGYLQFVGPLNVSPQQITDAGIIILEELFRPFDDVSAREFAVYNNTFMDMIDDVLAREFSVYNATYDDRISDVIAREFSVFNEP